MRPFIGASVFGLVSVFLFLVGILPDSVWGCACGCGVFDVQTSLMLPTGQGGIAFLNYDFVNQNRNWNGSSRGSDDNNSDKQLQSHFITAGVQYMFSRKWGFAAEVPVWNRYFKTTLAAGNQVAFNHTALGDIRLRGIYSGFSPNMSTGLMFGAKLPTGDYTNPSFDRDSEIGSGSTDLLLGAYHMGSITDDNLWSWFANILWDQPILIAAGYRPGAEINALAGAYYHGWAIQDVKVVPLAQAIESLRMRDGGTFGHSADSGYGRLMLGPGFELDADRWRLNGSISFPVAQYVNGNQLVASEFLKFGVAYRF